MAAPELSDDPLIIRSDEVIWKSQAEPEELGEV